LNKETLSSTKTIALRTRKKIERENGSGEYQKAKKVSLGKEESKARRYPTRMEFTPNEEGTAKARIGRYLRETPTNSKIL